MYPLIKLKINIKEDIKNAKGFLSKGGVWLDWFLPDNLKYVSSKKFTQKERENIIDEYTKHIHTLHKKKIEEGVAKISKQWDAKQKRFYIICDKLFKKHIWPKGKYIGYASIYNMYPRIIRDKTFFFSYNTEHKYNPLATIAHEMLHFIFFDFIHKKYGLKETSMIKGESKKYLWQVSEVFNNVIETWGPYNRIFKTSGKPYPGTERMFVKMKNDWKKLNDVDILLDKWLK